MSKPTNPKDAIAVFKLPLHLVSPIVKAYQAISHYLGNVKYGAWNWREGGARASIYRSALERHLDAWWEGEECDPDDGTPHLANALACLNILIDAKHAGKLIDDRPLGNAKALAAVREEFEALMPKILEKHKDKAPIHYTREGLGVKSEAPPRPYCGCKTHCEACFNPVGRSDVKCRGLVKVGYTCDGTPPPIKLADLPEKTADNFTRWDGRGRPVDLRARVDVIRRDGTRSDDQLAAHLRWEHSDGINGDPRRDIVYFRLLARPV